MQSFYSVRDSVDIRSLRCRVSAARVLHICRQVRQAIRLDHNGSWDGTVFLKDSREWVDIVPFVSCKAVGTCRVVRIVHACPISVELTTKLTIGSTGMAVTVRKIVQDYDNEWWRRFSSCITENALERDVAIGISDARNGIDPKCAAS